MTYDAHDVWRAPMMCPGVVGTPGAVGVKVLWFTEPVTGAWGYDDDNQPFARTYPLPGMRCS